MAQDLGYLLPTIWIKRSRAEQMPKPMPQTPAPSDESEMRDPKLRRLAGWYRAFAERAGCAAIWEGRLQMAGDLEAEADRIETRRCGGTGHR
jgi:hypothetical protein